jgi:hypothetical protein
LLCLVLLLLIHHFGIYSMHTHCPFKSLYTHGSKPIGITQTALSALWEK